MPGPFAPSDDVLGPIVHQLALYIAAQIPAIDHVYEKMPDRPPTDNQVLLPLIKAKIIDETSGKIKVAFTIGARHLFRRTEYESGVTRAQTFLMPWLKLLGAWSNQTLGGLAMEVDANEVQITQVAQSGQPFIALAVNFVVVTEFNIPTS